MKLDTFESGYIDFGEFYELLFSSEKLLAVPKNCSPVVSSGRLVTNDHVILLREVAVHS